MREPPFFKLERKTQFFSIVQISSKVRSYFVCGPIDLKFGGEVRDSLIFNMNGGDQIWSSGRSYFSPRTEPLFWWVFYPDSFDHELWSRLIHGSIELILVSTFRTHWYSFWTVKIGFGVLKSYILVREQWCVWWDLSIAFMQSCWNCQDQYVLRHGWCMPLVLSGENCITH